MQKTKQLKMIRKNLQRSDRDEKESRSHYLFPTSTVPAYFRQYSFLAKKTTQFLSASSFFNKPNHQLKTSLFLITKEMVSLRKFSVILLSLTFLDLLVFEESPIIEFVSDYGFFYDTDFEFFQIDFTGFLK